MARAGLGWSAADLGAKAGLARETVTRYESGSTIAPSTIKAMRGALEAAGADFLQISDKVGVAVPGAFQQ
ncbi:helix-turn-helix transcriptional regulator [Sphingopyxis sp. RIFCSPHIGHO2_12_FULL_65_19]|uniref:helix-turn-helix transcriptional regulator n=1 Tax=Sphingopyxis sp. RIFCSPHIGHO2_12_FULL_65_19 TaxID=1802172 RepID=UPI0034525DA0